MLIYAPSDFPTIQSLFRFLWGLRVPIPPIISALEIIAYQITGSTELITGFVYRLAIVCSYLIALQMAGGSILRRVISFVVSLIFVWGTVEVHRANPQIYDVFYPFFLLLWLFFLRVSKSTPPDKSIRYTSAAFLSGFFLSMAELSRPFVLLVLPILILGAIYFLGRHRWRQIALMILPILLVSGTWHFHLWTIHRQILWSNHGGFNLSQAWPQVDISNIELVPEVNNKPIAEGRWNNINTEEHGINSRLISTEIFRYIVAHPESSIRHSGLRLIHFLKDAAPIHISSPPLLLLFNINVLFALIYLFTNFTALILYTLASKVKIHWLFNDIDNLLLLSAVSTAFMITFGSAVEESRMVFSILPLLAPIPFVKPRRVDIETNFVAALIPPLFLALGLVIGLFGLAGDFIEGFRYGENLDQIERNIVYLGGIFFFLMGVVLFLHQRCTDPRAG